MLKQVAEFNGRFKGDDNVEMVCDINVAQIGNVFQTFRYGSLKDILQQLVGCLDGESNAIVTQSFIGDDKRMKSRQSRWFNLSAHPILETNYICRNLCVKLDDGFYKIMACFKKSYNKFRLIKSLDKNDLAGVLFVRKLNYRHLSQWYQDTSQFKRCFVKDIISIEGFLTSS